MDGDLCSFLQPTSSMKNLFLSFIRILLIQKTIFWNPKANAKTSGFLPHERQWMTKLLSDGWCDGFGICMAKDIKNTLWWSNRRPSTSKNRGWRIDYILINPNNIPAITSCNIVRQGWIRRFRPCTSCRRFFSWIMVHRNYGFADEKFIRSRWRFVDMQFIAQESVLIKQFLERIHVKLELSTIELPELDEKPKELQEILLSASLPMPCRQQKTFGKSQQHWKAGDIRLGRYEKDRLRRVLDYNLEDDFRRIEAHLQDRIHAVGTNKLTNGFSLKIYWETQDKPRRCRGIQTKVGKSHQRWKQTKECLDCVNFYFPDWLLEWAL